jgi:magnesium-transporting ATPase (P-type)
MEDLLMNVHSVWRWVVLTLAVLAIFFATQAARGARPWDPTSERVAFLFTLAVDIQVLIGVLLWLVRQEWGHEFFLAWVHPVLMLGAAGLAHVGRARADRATDSRDKGRTAAYFFAASLVVMLVAIPIAAWPL